MPAMISSCDRVPGSSESARAPTPGVPPKPPRIALPVETVPARRAEYELWVNCAQHAAVDQGVAARRETFAVDVGRGVGERVGRVVDEVDERRRDLVAEPILEQAAALDDGLAVERRRDDAEELCRDERVEHDRGPARVGLVAPSSRVARSAASRAARSRSRTVGVRPTLKPKPVWVSSPSSASVDTLT